MKGMQEVTRKVTSWIEGDKTPDAIDIIKNDHRKVEGLFVTFFNARTSDRKKQLLDQIIKELSVHATYEEDLVYPILEGCCGKQTTERTEEALEEHHLLKMALSELADMPITAKTIKAKMKVVQELVKDHIKEEEGDLLPKLQSSGTDLERLGREIEARKDKLMRGVQRGGGIGQNKGSRAKLATASRKTATKKSGIGGAKSAGEAPGRKKISSAKATTSTKRRAGSKTSVRAGTKAKAAAASRAKSAKGGKKRAA